MGVRLGGSDAGWRASARRPASTRVALGGAQHAGAISQLAGFLLRRCQAVLAGPSAGSARTAAPSMAAYLAALERTHRRITA